MESIMLNLGQVEARHRFRQDVCKFISIALLVGLVGCGSSDPSSNNISSVSKVAASTVVAPSGVSVSGLTKVSEVRISRTTFEYVFQVNLTNSGQAFKDVTVTLAAVGPGTTIVDGSASVANLPSGVTLSASDTIVLRQDRTVPFNSAALVWTISGTPVSPPEESLPGTDADGNGVRDDVQAYIASKVDLQPNVRNALIQFARGLQSAALSATPAMIDAALTERQNAAICLVDRTSPSLASALMKEIKFVQFSTDARISAEIAFNRAIGGKTLSFTPTATEGTCN